MNNELRELYQQVIIDHGRKPRNYSRDPEATHIKEGYNPLCGDQITFYLQAPEGVINKACFNGSGCAISMASASLLTEIAPGHALTDMEKLFTYFHELVTHGKSEQGDALLDKLTVLGGVAEFPSRVKCATLAWHTVVGALRGETEPVSTE